MQLHCKRDTSLRAVRAGIFLEDRHLCQRAATGWQIWIGMNFLETEFQKCWA